MSTASGTDLRRQPRDIFGMPEALRGHCDGLRGLEK